MKHLIVLALLAFMLPACGSSAAPPAPTYTPPPTYTPYPTQTPNPTYTPYPTYTALPAPPTVARSSATPLAVKNVESPTAASKCIAWNVASSHIGETTCVRGNVTSTYKDAKSNAFFIDFDNAVDSFYAVSFKYTWDNLKGQCVEISGKIAPYNGRAQIVVQNRSQVELCK